MGSTNDIFNVLSFLAVLRRQLRLILVIVAVILGVALIYILNATPIYSASTLIYVDPSNKDLLSSEERLSLSAGAENSRIESEVEILRSTTVAIETLNRADLIRDEEFGPSLSLSDKARVLVGIDISGTRSPEVLVATTLRNLQNAVSVRRKGLTYLISVSAQSEDGKKSARIANTMAQAYIDLQVAGKAEAARASRDVIQSQIDRARAQLAATEASFDAFIDDNLDQLGAEAGSASFDALRTQLQETRDDIAVSETRITSAQAALEGRDWAGVLDSLQDDALKALDDQRRQLEARLGEAETGSTIEMDLRAGLVEIEQRLDAQAAQSVAAMQSNLTDLRDDTGAIRNELRSELLQSTLSPETLTEIYAIQQEADIAQRQYRNLLSRMRDLEAQAMVQVADSRIVSAALTATRPTAPNKKVILGMAFVVALGAGGALALLNEFFVGGVTSLNQLRNIVPTRSLGAVPKAEMSNTQMSIADLVIDEPLSLFSEAIRRVRAGVDQTLRDHKGPDRPDLAHLKDDGKSKGQVIMVTSSVSGEGKSSLSLALARTYATAGKDVLLIDADLRKPALHKHINHEPNQGFLDYLTDPTEVNPGEPSFYAGDPLTNCGIILGRGRANVPTDQLLQSTAFESLLENAREQMDVIIIDTPPLGAVVDARYVAPLADAVIMLVRYSYTSQGDLREAYGQLRDAAGDNKPVLSVLAQDEAKAKDVGYYDYNYDM